MIKYARVKKMDNKTVLVTGASSGLGKEIIRLFAKNNYNCIINYLSHEKEALALQKEIEEKYNIELMELILIMNIAQIMILLKLELLI